MSSDNLSDVFASLSGAAADASGLIKEYYKEVIDSFPLDSAERIAVQLMEPYFTVLEGTFKIVAADNSDKIGVGLSWGIGIGVSGVTTLLTRNPYYGAGVGAFYGNTLEGEVADAINQYLTNPSVPPQVSSLDPNKVIMKIGDMEIITDLNTKKIILGDGNINKTTTFNDNGDIVKEVISSGTAQYEIDNTSSTIKISNNNGIMTANWNDALDADFELFLDEVITELESQSGGSAADVATAQALNALEAATGLTDTDYSNLYTTNEDGSFSVTDQSGNEEIYGPRTKEEMEALKGFGINADGQEIVEVTNADGNVEKGFVSNNSEVEINGETYNTNSLLDTVGKAAEELANFVSDQVDKAADWFTDEQGLQLDFANWFALNANDLVNGDLDPDEAFVEFAKYVASNRLGAYATDIIGVNDAAAAVGDVFVSVGVAPEEAAVISTSISQSFQRLAVAYVSNDFELSGDQARNIALSAVAS